MTVNTIRYPHRANFDRPKHAFSEGRYPGPLYHNPELPYPAIWLTRGAFRDYETLGELLTIIPTQEERCITIHWKDDLRNQPVFHSSSANGENTIESAGAFSQRHKELGIRAGFPVPPTIHDWRAEGLFLVGM